MLSNFTRIPKVLLYAIPADALNKIDGSNEDQVWEPSPYAASFFSMLVIEPAIAL